MVSDRWRGIGMIGCLFFGYLAMKGDLKQVNGAECSGNSMGIADGQAGFRPQAVTCLVTCVSVVDQIASPSFSSLICNNTRVTVLPSRAAVRSKERTVHTPSSVSDTRLGLT